MPSCLRLWMHRIRCDLLRPLACAGRKSSVRMPRTVMTTMNSGRVKALGERVSFMVLK